MLIVMKFGGTSVGSPERLVRAATLAVETAQRGHQIVVVTSAMSKVTDALVHAAREASEGRWDPAVRQALFERHMQAADVLAGADSERHASIVATLDQRLERFEKLCYGLSLVHELTPRLLDAISATGEMLSAPLLSAAIAALGPSSTAVEATELIVTTEHFGGAEPLMDPTRERVRACLLPLVGQGEIPVVTGFMGATTDGVLTTLGRGGTDYSASILGASLDADEVWIWTDVNGIMSANPGDVPDARTLPELSYSEASELAYFGAKVLHSKTILPCYRKRIPVRILNSFEPSHAGTRVTVDGDASAEGVKAVTSFWNVVLVAVSGSGLQGIPGIAAKAFRVVAEQKADLLMVSQASSENNLCFVVGSAEAPRVVRALREALAPELERDDIDEISEDHSTAIVAAVGDRMHGRPGVAATVFGALGDEKINVMAISQGSSERNISLVVTAKDAPAAVRAIHTAFHLERPTSPTAAS
jgi:aspartokinase/homoserine dehydrogenase 1